MWHAFYHTKTSVSVYHSCSGSMRLAAAAIETDMVAEKCTRKKEECFRSVYRVINGAMNLYPFRFSMTIHIDAGCICI